MAGENNEGGGNNATGDDAKKTLKSLFKETLDEWAAEREKTRTETGTKPKGLLENLLNL